MKILIACDKLSSADKFYNDLKRAGLPLKAEVLVLSVADVLIPPGYKKNQRSQCSHKELRSGKMCGTTHIDREIKKSQEIAVSVSQSLKRRFPKWHFSAEALGDSPAWGIVKKAKQWKADLVVVGSHGGNFAKEIFFGSTAQRVLAEVECSVRIVRGGQVKKNSPVRIVVGADGSQDSDRAVDFIASRIWKKGSSVLLVTAVDSAVLAAGFTGGSVMGKNKWVKKNDVSSTAWIERMHAGYKEKLKKAGLRVEFFKKEGNPNTMLVKESRRWKADTLFLGAKGHGMITRVLIGSVSSALASRAECSVEVVRGCLKKKVKN